MGDLSRTCPNVTSTHPWEAQKGLWKRVHVDFAAPIQGLYLLVLVDAFSKLH